MAAPTEMLSTSPQRLRVRKNPTVARAKKAVVGRVRIASPRAIPTASWQVRRPVSGRERKYSAQHNQNVAGPCVHKAWLATLHKQVPRANKTVAGQAPAGAKRQ